MTHQNLDLAALLHRKGYRLTPQRQMVLDAVCEVGGHATPEKVYFLVQQKSPAVNRATIYRALKFLNELDLITVTVSVDGHVEYEIAGAEPHHHLVCRDCGFDIEITGEDLSMLAESLQRKYGFLMETNHFTLMGLCSECQNEISEAAPALQKTRIID